VLGRQLRGCVGQLTPEQFRGIVIAYEPVGRSEPAKWLRPRSPPRRTSFIRRLYPRAIWRRGADACRILYGGSVKPDNVIGLMAEDEIDGALVGGASLDPASFAAIVNF
jgi:triosephosphate isomerase